MRTLRLHKIMISNTNSSSHDSREDIRSSFGRLPRPRDHAPIAAHCCQQWKPFHPSMILIWCGIHYYNTIASFTFPQLNFLFWHFECTMSNNPNDNEFKDLEDKLHNNPRRIFNLPLQHETYIEVIIS